MAVLESDLVLRKFILKFGRTTCLQMVQDICIYIYIVCVCVCVNIYLCMNMIKRENNAIKGQHLEIRGKSRLELTVPFFWKIFCKPGIVLK